MDNDELIRIWERFSDKSAEFKLNPDKNLVNMVAEGVLGNEKKTGLKLCPCRVSDGTREGDLKLICPCNFKIHTTWNTQGRCWCGLFVKR